MLILFTSDKSDRAEKEQLIELMENGLDLLHVRKPGMNEEEQRTWLEGFEAGHLQKMVLHEHHHLAVDFPVRGIHLKEGFRRKQKDLERYISRFRTSGLSISSSFHDPACLKMGAFGFDYVLLSPVFSSLSKTGHKGKTFDVKESSHPVIALGGVETGNLAKVKNLGYAGAAVLGAVWLAEDKSQRFAEIQKEYKNVYQ